MAAFSPAANVFHYGQEVFGTGTAAVVSPVGKLKNKNEELIINNGKIGDLSLKLYEKLTGIQYGRIEDKHNWRVKVC